MSTQRTLLCLIFVIGCDGGSGKSEQPDAATPDSPLPDAHEPRNVVEVDTFGEEPVFIRYREGTGPWKTPQDTSTGFELLIDERYELVAVCGSSATGYEVGYEANTLEESAGSTFLPCFGVGGTTEPPVMVSGTMAQPGSVALGNARATSTTANWSFQLAVDPGILDLIAIGNGRITIRRDLNISAATTLPAIDVIASGTAMAAVPLTVTGTPGDMLRTRTYLFSANGFTNLTNETGTTARFVPTALLQTMDIQFLNVTATTGNTYRSAFTRYKTTAPTIAMLPALTGVQFGATSATWSAIPDGGRELFAFSGSNSLRAFATQGFLGTKTTLAVDLDIPGLKDEWKLGVPEYQNFEVMRSEADLSLRTGVEQIANAKNVMPHRGIDRMMRHSIGTAARR